MPSTKRHTGLICFLDILGYQEFLQQNHVADIVAETLSTLRSMPRVMESYMRALLRADLPICRRVLRDVRWLVISDSILITCPISERDSFDHNLLRWSTLLYQTCFFFRRMFSLGHPLRGAITYGDFLIEDSCFAGRPIVEAHQLGASLELAGVVASNGVLEQLQKMPKTEEQADIVRDMIKSIFCEYDLPLKGGTTAKHFVLDVSRVVSSEFEALDDEIRSKILKAFTSHNKQLAPSVTPKVDNTERLFHHLVKKLADDYAQPKDGIYEFLATVQQPKESD